MKPKISRTKIFFQTFRSCFNDALKGAKDCTHKNDEE